MVGEFGEAGGARLGLAKPKGHADHALLRRCRKRKWQETQEGMVLGTPAYMSPGQRARGAISDVDGEERRLEPGGGLYQSSPPAAVQGKRAMDVIVKSDSSRWLPVRELNKDAPRELAAVCEKALREEAATLHGRGKRWPTRCSPAERRARLRVRVFLRRAAAPAGSPAQKLTAVVALAAVLVTARRCWPPSSTARRGGSWRAPSASARHRRRPTCAGTAPWCWRRRRAASWTSPTWTSASRRVLHATCRRLRDPGRRHRLRAGLLPRRPDARGRRRDRTIDVLQVPGGKRRARLEGNESTSSR